jgi:hypothetical protein
VVEAGVEPSEIGIFVRSKDQLIRARAAVRAAGHTQLELSERHEAPEGRIAIGAMHLAKGLEYKAIAVMACDDDILPLRERLEAVADEAELEEAFETERQLFYVGAQEREIGCLYPERRLRLRSWPILGVEQTDAHFQADDLRI